MNAGHAGAHRSKHDVTASGASSFAIQADGHLKLDLLPMVVALVDCSSSAFGGPCNTPTAERLAAGGLKYNRFHTTALCSPSRQALLTGRDPHALGMGGITELATRVARLQLGAAEELRAARPRPSSSTATATAQFGKCHEVPVWETSPAGPFDGWPTAGQFEYFYGFIGGETNQWHPTLYRAPCRSKQADVRRGLPLHRGHDGPRDRLDRAADGAHARQAVLRLLRAGRHSRPAPRAEGMGG